MTWGWRDLLIVVHVAGDSSAVAVGKNITHTITRGRRVGVLAASVAGSVLWLQ